MGYVSIDTYIDTVKNSNLPKNYYGTRFHRDYIRSLSLDDYSKWLGYLKKEELKRYKKYKKKNREEINRKNREKWQSDSVFREHKREQHRQWVARNPEKIRGYYQNSKQKREKSWLKYYRENKERILKRMKEYYADKDNWLKHKISHCDWYMKKREDKEFMKKNCERAKKWQRENKEKRRKYIREYMRKYNKQIACKKVKNMV